MNFVAFSGGLDSTWIMNDLLSRGEKVFPIQVNVGSISTQLLPETLARRAMLIEFNKLYPGLIHNEAIVPNQTMYQVMTRGIGLVPGTSVNPKNFVDSLIQQSSVRNAMVMAKYALSMTGDEFFAGWHKDDVKTTFKEELYRSLANPEVEELVYTNTQHLLGNVPLQIQLPCWELDKREMWDSIPENIRQWIMVASRPRIAIKDGVIGVEQVGTKVNEYTKLGITVYHHQHQLKLDPIDHYFLHNTNVDHLGDLPDYSRPGFEWYEELVKYLKENKHRLREDMHFVDWSPKDMKTQMGILVKSLHFNSERERWVVAENRGSKVWTNEYPRETDSRAFAPEDLAPPGCDTRDSGRVDPEAA